MSLAAVLPELSEGRRQRAILCQLAPGLAAELRPALALNCFRGRGHDPALFFDGRLTIGLARKVVSHDGVHRLISLLYARCRRRGNAGDCTAGIGRLNERAIAGTMYAWNALITVLHQRMLSNLRF